MASIQTASNQATASKQPQGGDAVAQAKETVPPAWQLCPRPAPGEVAGVNRALSRRHGSFRLDDGDERVCARRDRRLFPRCRCLRIPRCRRCSRLHRIPHRRGVTGAATVSEPARENNPVKSGKRPQRERRPNVRVSGPEWA
uniref:Uncharacterized protein n=1 Tax=Oryza sativa subsp. japonica TaxID=39947 RepID=Q6ZF63_ORYSJ|nr:hypothetical protein [Oryza sativa Japonica Group]